jgi:hypothetical protein
MAKFLPNPAGFSAPDFHVFFDDFDRYAAGDWKITTVEAGGSSASEAVSDADGGVLVITNDAGADDYDAFQLSDDGGTTASEGFTFTEGKRMYIGARFKLSAAASSNLVIGLHDIDTDPVGNTISDGIFFRKDEDANLDFRVVGSSTATNVAALKTLANDTWYVVEAYYDGATDGKFILYVDGVVVGSAVIDNAPSTELAVSFAIENGAAASEVLSLDWILIAKER